MVAGIKDWRQFLQQAYEYVRTPILSIFAV